MRNLLLTLAPCAAALLLACGGGDNPPPNTADNAPSASAPPADTTPPPPPVDTTPAPSASAPPADTTPAPPPAPPPITVSALKFTASAPGFVSAELQADGSIVVKGKTVAKINNNEVDDPTGKALFTVGADGSLAGDGLEKKASFSGDDLTGDEGVKISIADDGTVSFTGPKGKTKKIGKIDNVGSAKRAAAIVVAYHWLTHEHKEGGKKGK
jgi:hypothetical protein